MERPHVYKARFVALAAARFVWEHRRVTWVFLVLALPTLLLSLPVHGVAKQVSDALEWPYTLLMVPLTVVGVGLGEALLMAPSPEAGHGVRALLAPRFGRLVWLGVRYFCNLWLAAFKGFLVSALFGVLYFVITAATGFLDARDAALTLNFIAGFITATSWAGILAYFVLRVVADWYMAPVWIVRGMDVDRAVALSRQHAAGRFWHIMAVVGWVTLLPCVVGLVAFLDLMRDWQALAQAGSALDLTQITTRVTGFGAWVGCATWAMAPIAAMAPALMERMELAWAMPPQTQIVNPALEPPPPA